VIHATPLRPTRIERESQVRLETRVTADHGELNDTTNLVPYFAFITRKPGDERPMTWLPGEFRHQGQVHIAATPITNFGPLSFEPGFYFGYLRVPVMGQHEAPVVSVGRVQVV
jgi:hypothetical protein